MKNLAIITARGGSKRIPKKNIKDFLGKPIIAYAIEAALNSGIFSEVMVSTDDNEIAEIAKRYGANVPFKRSEKNSDDHATTNDVVLEVVSQYQKSGYDFDFVCCIYPTAPFVNADLLKYAFQIMESNDYDCVLPTCQFSFPILRSFKVDENGMVQYAFPEYRNTRSQDLPRYSHDAGQFYFINVRKYKISKKIIGEKNFGIVRSELEVQDIDTETDWKLAEMKYQILNQK